MPISKKTITLLCISTDDVEGGINVVEESFKKFPYFDKCIVGGKESSKRDQIEILDLSHIKNARGYNEFCIYGLKDIIDTDFVLVIQTDGYILNPNAWLNIYLNYDYVGAPWYWFDNICGNGGFSLRSKKFIEESAKLFPEYKWDDPTYVPHLYSTCPEDFFLCVQSRKNLLEKGVKFAPGDVAQNFSFEYPIGLPNEGMHSSFGFHGKHNLTKINE